MKRKGIFKLVRLPIYNIDIAISANQDYKSFKKSIYSTWDLPEIYMPKEEEMGGVGCAMTICREKGEHLIPYAIKFEGNISKYHDRHQVISHEVFHATYRILFSRGMFLTYQSEEAYAYLTGHLVREIYKIIK
jgi:hypothetical protein